MCFIAISIGCFIQKTFGCGIFLVLISSCLHSSRKALVLVSSLSVMGEGRHNKIGLNRQGSLLVHLTENSMGI